MGKEIRMVALQWCHFSLRQSNMSCGCTLPRLLVCFLSYSPIQMVQTLVAAQTLTQRSLKTEREGLCRYQTVGVTSLTMTSSPNGFPPNNTASCIQQGQLTRDWTWIPDAQFTLNWYTIVCLAIKLLWNSLYTWQPTISLSIFQCLTVLFRHVASCHVVLAWIVFTGKRRSHKHTTKPT